MKLLFERERDTKNTIRYAEVPQTEDEPVVVGTLYIQKFAARELGNPERVVVTIEARE